MPPSPGATLIRTCTLAFAEVLFGCVPDGHDIDRVIEDEASSGCASFDPGEVRIVRGLVLTSFPRLGDDVVWCSGPGDDLLDAEGRAYRYAVRRPSPRHH
ncbi:MAG: hypothetical protein PGN34_19790 [Methylobacterium frigidaeris]